MASWTGAEPVQLSASAVGRLTNATLPGGPRESSRGREQARNNCQESQRQLDNGGIETSSGGAGKARDDKTLQHVIATRQLSLHKQCSCQECEKLIVRRR